MFHMVITVREPLSVFVWSDEPLTRGACVMTARPGAGWLRLQALPSSALLLSPPHFSSCKRLQLVHLLLPPRSTYAVRALTVRDFAATRGSSSSSGSSSGRA